MIRPFMSSDGSWTTETVVSVTTSERDAGSLARIRLARRSASSRALISRSLTTIIASPGLVLDLSQHLALGGSDIDAGYLL